MIFDKIKAYREIFDFSDKNLNKKALADVMKDLRKFCRVDYPTIVRDLTGKVDPVAMAYLEGRREVYLRIIGYAKANQDMINQLIEQERLNDERARASTDARNYDY